MIQFLKYHILFWNNFFGNVFNVKREYAFSKKGVIHFHIRAEVAKKIFTDSYSRLGKFIQVTEKQYKKLSNIEGSKLSPNFDRDDELAIAIKEVISECRED